MMIKSLELENYRGFKRYKLSGLSRANLLVGKNNSGKTSILEAMNVLAAIGDPYVLARIAQQRGEVLVDSKKRDSRLESYADMSHFFFNHSINQDAYFSLASDGPLGRLSAKIGPVTDVVAFEDFIGFPYNELGPRALLGLQIEGTHTPTGAVFPVTEDGALFYEQVMRSSRFRGWRSAEWPVLFISPDSLQRSQMTLMWDKVATDGREQDVVKAMQILEPSLTSIVFLSGERSYRYETRGGILVGFEGSRKRYPLGSYGEGMRRLLALALSLAVAQNGILLIDEIDTGLHYSIMGDMWLLVVEAAKRYNIQVFVTTHSFDCIRGLAWLCKYHPELADQVSIQKIERELDEAVSLDSRQIQIAVEQGFEVR